MPLASATRCLCLARLREAPKRREPYAQAVRRIEQLKRPKAASGAEERILVELLSEAAMRGLPPKDRS
jgi:hypothetical protein